MNAKERIVRALNQEPVDRPPLAAVVTGITVEMIGTTVEFLLQGTSESVYAATLECLGKGVDILAPGCSLPQHTPLANIEAMRQALNDYTQHPSARKPVPHVIVDLLASKQVQLNEDVVAAAAVARQRRAQRKRNRQ